MSTTTLCRPDRQRYRLAALLNAATGPARPGELAREDAVLAGFRLLIATRPSGLPSSPV